MKRKIIVSALLILSAIALVVFFGRFGEHYNTRDITTLETISLSTIESKLLEKTSATSIEKLSGMYSSIPFSFAKELASTKVSSSGKYIIVVGAEPLTIGNRGSLVCATPKNSNVVYLCEIRNKDFDAFSATPPFSFQEAKLDSKAEKN